MRGVCFASGIDVDNDNEITITTSASTFDAISNAVLYCVQEHRLLWKSIREFINLPLTKWGKITAKTKAIMPGQPFSLGAMMEILEDHII